MTKTLIIVALTVATGALIGNSQILCPDGQCMITGSWFGGAAIGGAVGAAITGLL